MSVGIGEHAPLPKFDYEDTVDAIDFNVIELGAWHEVDEAAVALDGLAGPADEPLYLHELPYCNEASRTTAIAAMQKTEGVRLEKGHRGAWLVVDGQDIALNMAPIQVTEDGLVSIQAVMKGLRASWETVSSVAAELGLLLEERRVITQDGQPGRPGLHLKAADIAAIEQQLELRYPPVDPTVEQSVSSIAWELNRDRATVRMMIRRSKLPSHIKYDNKRKAAQCVDLETAQHIKERLGVKEPEYPEIEQKLPEVLAFCRPAYESESLEPGASRDYHQHISRYPLLNAEQEVVLGFAIQKGIRAAAKLEEMGPKSRAKHAIAELEGQVTLAGQARDAMLLCNLRLVMKRAIYWKNKLPSHIQMDENDLFQEGLGVGVRSDLEPRRTGLLNAVNKFDPTMGYKFSTYAVNWIDQAIHRAVADHGMLISVPVYKQQEVSSFHKIRDGLQQRLNRMPSLAELSELVKLSESEICDLEEVEKRFIKEPISLHAPLRTDADGDLVLDTIASEEDVIEAVDQKQALYVGLARLGESQRTAVMLSYGFGGDPLGDWEIAERMGCSEQLVRHWIDDSMRQLQLELDAA